MIPYLQLDQSLSFLPLHLVALDFYHTWEHHRPQWLMECVGEFFGVFFYVYAGVGATAAFNIGGLTETAGLGSKSIGDSGAIYIRTNAIYQVCSRSVLHMALGSFLLSPYAACRPEGKFPFLSFDTLP